jgi:hypothetical protein
MKRTRRSREEHGRHEEGGGKLQSRDVEARIGIGKKDRKKDGTMAVERAGSGRERRRAMSASAKGTVPVVAGVAENVRGRENPLAVEADATQESRNWDGKLIQEARKESSWAVLAYSVGSLPQLFRLAAGTEDGKVGGWAEQHGVADASNR